MASEIALCNSDGCVCGTPFNIEKLLLRLQLNHYFPRKRWLACTLPVLLALGVGLHAHNAVAQTNVGIGTTTPAASAILDLTSTSMGFLTPRMTTANKLAITSPATGLLVYDNTLNTFYYYNGTAWVPFVSSSGASAGWMILGNAGTVATTNFLGTTDANDLVFRTNNVEGMRLTTGSDLAVGVTTATQKVEVGGNVRVDPVGGVASQFQFMNPANTFATTFAAGAQLATINYTLPTVQGAANTVLTNNGSGVLSWASASNNGWLLLGNAGTTPGTNFLGTTDANDLVFKTNSTEGFRLTSGGNVGIGTTTPGQKLEVQGNTKIDPVAGVASQLMFGNPAGTFTSTFAAGAQLANINYTLPLAQGAANTILSNNGAGVLSWTASSAYDWTLLGNAGTVAGTNFLGTTDNIDLVFKTNATEGMRLTATQNLGIGTAVPTSILHTVASGAKVANYTGNLLTNTATSSTASITKYGTDIQSTGTWNGTTAVNVGLHVNATGGTTNYSALFQGGNVGINTTTPATYMDVNGDMSTRYTSYTASNGANNNIVIGASSFVRITGPSAAFSISGIAGGVDGKLLVLFNSTSQTITISNDNASSTAANRIWTLNSVGDLVFAGKVAVKLIYSAADSRWIVVSSSTTVSTSTSGVITKKKPSDESVTSSTTLQNDNDLFIPINANDSMVIEGYLHTYTASTTPGITIAFTIPTSASMDVGLYCDDVSLGTQETFILTSSGTQTGDILLNSGDIPIHFWGIVITGANSGNIQLQWAQGASSSTATTVKAKSYMRAYYIR
jgi:hypothetical protein